MPKGMTALFTKAALSSSKFIHRSIYFCINSKIQECLCFYYIFVLYKQILEGKTFLYFFNLICRRLALSFQHPLLDQGNLMWCMHFFMRVYLYLRGVNDSKNEEPQPNPMSCRAPYWSFHWEGHRAK